MNKKILYGLIVPMLAILIIGVTAVTLSYFGVFSNTVIVNQGLTLDGNDWDEEINKAHSMNSLQNLVFISGHQLENTADVDVEVNLDYTCLADETADCDGIITKYYETNLYEGTLTLSKKNSGWDEITIDNDVIITYSTNNGDIVIDSITSDDDLIDYTLIYYADENFDDDGVRLETPGQAYILGIGSIIPISADDGNLKADADYCVIDGYDHCKGIKLWLIRTADLDTNTITWNANWQSDYYFETDMLGWNHNDGEIPTPLEVSGNSMVDFVVVSDFPVLMKPDTYTLITSVNPIIA